jgi:hypothetical protein
MSALISSAYRLVRQPRQPFTVPANAYRMPLGTPADYARALQCESPGGTVDSDPLAQFDTADNPRRVLLDNLQYFAFLAELSTRIRQDVHPGVHLFVEVCAPYFGALPEALLHPDVLLGVSLTSEARWHAERGEPVIWIADRILRDLDFAGDNSVHCAVWPRSLVTPFDELMRSDWSHFGIGLRPTPVHPISPIRRRRAAGEYTT